MIDAHHHCWQIGQHGCVWPTPDLTAIYRDCLPAEYEAQVRALGITGSVLVQAQEDDRDTDFLLQLAQASELIQAVVGWVDLLSQAAPARIVYLAQQPKFRGLRPMMQGYADDAWMLQPELAPAIAAMIEQRISFDALIMPRHLPYLIEFVRRYPALPVVIDHGAKPIIALGEIAAWREQMTILASFPQVFCKLSGLLNEMSATQSANALVPYVEHLFAQFGAERLMWGSDWPVLNLAPPQGLASFELWFGLAKQLLPQVSLQDLEHIFYGTARRFYRI